MTSYVRSTSSRAWRAPRANDCGPAAHRRDPDGGAYPLPTLIRSLTRAYADLDINVRETLTPKLIQELAEGRLDTAIVALPVSEPSFEEVALFAEDFLLVRPGADAGQADARRQDASGDEVAFAGGGSLLSRSGLVVLQPAFRAAARIVGRQALSRRWSRWWRRNWRDIDSGNGGRGRDAFRARVRHAVRQSEAFANHRHDLAPDQSIDQTAYADFGRRAPIRRRTARAAPSRRRRHAGFAGAWPRRGAKSTAGTRSSRKNAPSPLLTNRAAPGSGRRQFPALVPRSKFTRLARVRTPRRCRDPRPRDRAT